MSIEPQVLRQALGRYTTGVTIITCLDADGLAVGLTVNSFAALSLEPPLVLWSLRRVSPSLPAFEQASHFAVNVLTRQQVELSRRFTGPAADRFQAGQWSAGLGGAPLLADSLAVFECALDSQQVAGDHQLFIGRVLRLAQQAEPPLVFQSGHYRQLGEVL
jgi:flavin reductase (DIM6/NTAB) family NADH-FMN oxidoreductase RutF